MNKFLKSSILMLGLATAFGFSYVDKAYAEIPVATQQLTLAQRNEINDQISQWRSFTARDNNDWEAHANLTLLYYDKGDYSNSYKSCLQAERVFEQYDIQADDDLMRESMVKGAASAYNLGKRDDAERILNRMLNSDLQGSEQNKNTYNGMANYYLADINRASGNYSQSYTYINNAVSYSPENNYFRDFLEAFYILNGNWYYNHRHVHRVTYIMPYRTVYVYPRHRVHRPIYRHRPHPYWNHDHRVHPIYHKRPYDHRVHGPRPGDHRFGKPGPRPGDHRFGKPGPHKPGVIGKPLHPGKPGIGKPGVRPIGQKPGFTGKPGIRPGQHPSTITKPGQKPGFQRPVGQKPGFGKPGVRPIGQKPNMIGKPGVRPGQHPSTITKPGIKKPGFQRPVGQKPNMIGKPAVRPGQRPSTISKPGFKKPSFQRPAGTRPSVSRPAVRKPSFGYKPSVSRPAAKPAYRPSVSRPAYKPAYKPASRPAYKPSSSKSSYRPSSSKSSSSSKKNPYLYQKRR